MAKAKDGMSLRVKGIVRLEVQCFASPELFEENFEELVEDWILSELEYQGGIPCEGDGELNTECEGCAFGMTEWLGVE